MFKKISSGNLLYKNGVPLVPWENKLWALTCFLQIILTDKQNVFFLSKISSFYFSNNKEPFPCFIQRLKTIVLVLLLTTFGTDVKRFKTNFNYVLLNNIQTQNYQAALQKVILLNLIEWKSFWVNLSQKSVGSSGEFS